MESLRESQPDPFLDAVTMLYRAQGRAWMEMPTHYQILASRPNDSISTILSAYINIVLANHPDKTSTLPADERTDREQNCKDAINAYEVSRMWRSGGSVMSGSLAT
ncbi:hypothetical protein K469DRAFT_747957 [Zopfia rhizophila CBS 207.26]|uniref:J domain-containing protein n=1 Tax=Zopfia rhizophila CBS 207.26 TaxID=1314779 RepID=A0A6A6EGI6_9PEZI|nr:hypothetical protein K469DRAFT_747957 [Zopfia rhizophila CBS 207.26]